jgi:hypothetical protein
MFKNLSVLPVFAALLVGTACGEDISKSTGRLSSAEESKASKDKDRDGASSDATSGSSGSKSSDSEIPATGDFEIAFDDLVTQAAPWGDVEISIEKARLVRGDKPAGFPSDVKHSDKAVYAILDLQLEAKGSTETDYRDRDTWDLLLASDKRVTPLNPVGELLLPGDEPKVSLFYEVSTDVSLRGASLEVNGSERDVLEPLQIPLDDKKAFESQVELSEIVGESFEPEDDGEWTFEIVDASYGVNLEDSGRRAPRDHRFVELTVRVGHEGDSSKSFAIGDAPRLAIGERSVAPEDFDGERIDGGESLDFVMVYAIDEDASDFDLVVDMGEDLFTTSVELPSLLKNDDASFDDGTYDEDDDAYADDCGCSADEEFDSEEEFSTDDEFETDDSFDFSDDEEFDSEDASSDEDEFDSSDDEDSEDNARN